MFTIIEIQTNDNTSVIANCYADRATAEQAYHNALAYAAVSDLAVHTVMMITPTGGTIKKESYTHNN